MVITLLRFHPPPKFLGKGHNLVTEHMLRRGGGMEKIQVQFLASPHNPQVEKK